MAQLTYYGLFALQHRGQEACGIVVNDDGLFNSYKDTGLVNDVFTAERLASLGNGNMAVGHVRYATTGATDRINAQPIVVNHIKGRMALAHNGNIVNSELLRRHLENKGSLFQSTSDSEILAHLIKKETRYHDRPRIFSIIDTKPEIQDKPGARELTGLKEKIEFQSVVAETLLIPLYMRAKESRRKGDAILKDTMAEQLVNSIEYDYSQFDGAKMSEVGCVVRGKYFDDAIRRFILSHSHPVVVNVGCGLDTRYQRIGNDQTAVFYELDLPEVIDLRRKLIPETGEDRYIAASLLETGWMDALKKQHPEGQFIFVVEGVLMYFYEEQVKTVLKHIAKRFSGGELWFDVCGKMMVKSGAKPDSLRKSAAEIRSGISDGHEVESWVPALELIEQACYQKFFTERWGTVMRLFARFPRFSCKFSSLLGYRIK